MSIFKNLFTAPDLEEFPEGVELVDQKSMSEKLYAAFLEEAAHQSVIAGFSHTLHPVEDRIFCLLELERWPNDSLRAFFGGLRKLPTLSMRIEVTYDDIPHNDFKDKFKISVYSRYSLFDVLLAPPRKWGSLSFDS